MNLEHSLKKLADEFYTWNWTYCDDPDGGANDKIFYWPGDPREDIMICVLSSRHIAELFHRQDFFFFNYAYTQDYQALSAKFDNLITVHENECYIGQPHSGYALRGDSDKDITIIGVLIQKETFFREYLPSLASDNSMFHFFLDPQTDKFADEFIHLSFAQNSPVRALLEMMVTEYADRREDTHAILKPMVLTLLMQIARQYRLSTQAAAPAALSDQIIRYMGEHSEVTSLKEIAAHFSYHPNYLSAILRSETGRTFSELLLEQRMERATHLLRQTTLSVEEVSSILGYGNTSNFYRAFKEYHGVSPREYLRLKS